MALHGQCPPVGQTSVPVCSARPLRCRDMDPEPRASTPSEASLIHTFLATRDEPCPACNYNLRGIAADTCPECGSRLEMTLRRVQRDFPSIAGVLALGCLLFLIGGATWGIVNVWNTPASSMPQGFLTQYIAMHSALGSLSLASLTIGIMRWRRGGRTVGMRVLVVCALACLLLEKGYWIVYGIGIGLRLW